MMKNMFHIILKIVNELLSLHMRLKRLF